MSGISGIGAYNANLFQWLTQSASTDGDQDDQSLANVGSLPATALDSSAGTSSSDETSSALFKTIRSAVLSALQEAEKSGNTGDLKKVVLDAVNQALKDNGLDPQTLAAQSASGSINGSQAGDLFTQLLSSQNGSQDMLGYLLDENQ